MEINTYLSIITLNVNGLNTPIKRPRVGVSAVVQWFRNPTAVPWVLLKLFQKFEEKGILPKTFYEAAVTLKPKSDKDTTKKENYRLIIFDEYRCKNSQQKFSQLNRIQQHIKNIYHNQVGFIPSSQGWFNIHKSTKDKTT